MSLNVLWQIYFNLCMTWEGSHIKSVDLPGGGDYLAEIDQRSMMLPILT